MMAVKEIAIQPNDAHTIRKVSEELKILEGVNHLNIVKYYGIEVQKVRYVYVYVLYNTADKINRRLL